MVVDMTEIHASKLDDFDRLCANCHRDVHSELRRQVVAIHGV